jgi:hypothetical protein
LRAEGVNKANKQTPEPTAAREFFCIDGRTVLCYNAYMMEKEVSAMGESRKNYITVGLLAHVWAGR